MKHKIGDIVVIKSDLIPGKIYGKYNFNQFGSMNIYCGKIVKITSLSKGLEAYQIFNCPEFFWTDEMIERFATEEEKQRFILETMAEVL